MGIIKTVAISGSADITVHDSSAGQIVRVLGYTIVAAGTVTLTWKSATTAISGVMTAGAGIPISAPMVGNRDYPHLQTVAGEDLILAVGGVVVVGGHATIEVQS